MIFFPDIGPTTNLLLSNSAAGRFEVTRESGYFYLLQ